MAKKVNRSADSPARPETGQMSAPRRIGSISHTNTPSGPRRSLGPRASIGGSSAPAPPETIVIESQRFEEWMKIASDNKITSNNTWNLALIDYFHDMSLLRNRDDNSINFQKASCTLDGCVKIWTSRVDSVANETGKLLSGLSYDNTEADDVTDDDVGGDGDGDGDGSDSEERRAKKTKSTQTSTLVNSFSKIKVKNFDLEFTVDPLFKKTSADFDEGGAGGILMNHLGVDRNLRIVFDASDAKLDSEEGGENREESEAFVDLTRLRSRFLPDIKILGNMTLCPSLSAFRFSSKEMISLGDPSDSGEGPKAFDSDSHSGDLPALVDDNGEEYDFFEAPNLMDNSPDPAKIVDDIEGGFVDHELVVDMDKSYDDNAVMDYFNTTKTKNWAGPHHWKLQRLKITAPNASTDGGAAPTVSKTKKEKEPFSVDFSAPPPLTRKELFKPPTQASSIRMPKLNATRASTNTLPEDEHFSGAQLLRLFLKKKASIRMRRRQPAGFSQPSWAAANEPERFEVGGADFTEYAYGMEERQNDYEDMTGVLPFTSAFSDDDEDDDPFFDAVGDLAGDDDLLAATQGTLSRVRPEQVHYAKRAKRVDLKKLKDVIWTELQPVSIPVKELPSERTYVPEYEQDVSDTVDGSPPTPRSLDSDDDEPKKVTLKRKNAELLPVLSGIQKAYPDKRMEDISTSYCFICLLHLANEKGLQIQTPELPDSGEYGKESKTVGGIDTLRVFRTVD